MTEEIINFEHDNLNEKEKEEAKQNGFIFIGKTGNGLILTVQLLD